MSMAQKQWVHRIRQVAGAYGVCILSPKQVLSRATVDDADDIKKLMWAETEREFSDYCKWAPSPNDCDSRVLQTSRRSVYMTYKCMDQSEEKNINIPASRILIERGILEPAMLEPRRQHTISVTYACPSDHVVFHQTLDGKLIDYPHSQFFIDWPRMFLKKYVPYRELTALRYTHYSQALKEYDTADTRSQLTKFIIQRVMRVHVGPLSHWTRAQLAILGSALSLMYKRDWDYCSRLPRCA